LPFRHKMDERDQIYEHYRRVTREHVGGLISLARVRSAP
jgi:hypothetical protein